MLRCDGLAFVGFCYQRGCWCWCAVVAVLPEPSLPAPDLFDPLSGLIRADRLHLK